MRRHESSTSSQNPPSDQDTLDSFFRAPEEGRPASSPPSRGRWLPVVMVWSLVAVLAGVLVTSLAVIGSSGLAGRDTATLVDSSSRRCWDGSEVTGGASCTVPTGLTGLKAVSTAFAAARREGRCRQDEIPPSQGAYRCDVDGAELVFAWFETGGALSDWFQQTYPDCRPMRYAQVCDGASRQALRYADPRFRVQVTAATTDSKVLLGTPLVPVARLLRGAEVS